MAVVARIEDVLERAEELTLELEAIDCGIDIDTARARLELARKDPRHRPSTHDTDSRLSVEALPWLRGGDDEVSDGDVV